MSLFSPILLALHFLAGNSLKAQVWEYLGTPTNEIHSLVVVGSDTIYAAGVSLGSLAGGIHRTTNGGTSWDTLTEVMVSHWELKIHPLNEQILYASVFGAVSPGGIIKTTDGGTSWNPAGEGIYVDSETSVFAIAIDPVHPETLYAGTTGYVGGDVYQSTDGGSSWVAIGDGPGIWDGVSSLAIDPLDNNIIYAGGGRGQGLFKSIDGGATWITTDFPAGGSVAGIEINRSNTNHVYVSVEMNGAGFQHTTDGGVTWSPSVVGLPSNTIGGSLVLNPATNDLFIVVFPDSVGLFKSSDLGTTWTRVTGITSQYWGLALALSSDHQQLYIALRNTGLYRTNVVSSVAEEDIAPSPKSVTLRTYPNPFNQQIAFELQITRQEMVTVTLFDVLGREFAMPFRDVAHRGRNLFWVHTGDLASGVYFVRVNTSSGYELTQRIMLIR